MIARLLMRLFVALSALATIGGLGWMYADPPPGMRADRDGVPHLSPPVVDPSGGAAIPLADLVRHFKGGGK